MNFLIISNKPEFIGSIIQEMGIGDFEFIGISKKDNFFTVIREKSAKGIILELDDKEITDFTILKQIKNFDPLLEVVIVGPRMPVQQMAEVLKLGAFDYLFRPLEVDALRPVLDRIDEMIQLRQETLQLEKELKKKYVFQGMVGKSVNMLEIYSQIERVAKHSIPVLITGEAGTGKDMVAKAIHELSERQQKKLIMCDCRTIKERDFEAELFGYVDDGTARSGPNRNGFLLDATGSTLQIDEISVLPTDVQSAFLAVLETQRFRPLGAAQDLPVDFRLISTSTHDLRDLIRTDRFREDLLRRISVIEIHLPPLRHRLEDVPLLVRHFIEKFDQKTGKNIKGISRRAQKALIAYPWPGNVRELSSVIEQAVTACNEEFMDLRDFPDYLTLSETATPAKPTPAPAASLDLEQMEKTFVLEALKRCENDRKAAARMLGLSLPTLTRKMKKYSISG